MTRPRVPRFAGENLEHNLALVEGLRKVAHQRGASVAATAVAWVLAQGRNFSVASLCRPEGYAGVDGVLALQPDGTVRRGLAVFEIQGGAPVMIEPAPASLATAAI